MPRYAESNFPPGSELIDFENIEGVIVVESRLEGSNGRDTSVTLALDTGAGFLALDRPLARALGIDDDAGEGALDYSSRPLSRLRLGSLEIDQVSPVLTLDARMIREVTDRPVVGLLGQRIFTDRGLWIDYMTARAAIVPIPHESDAASISAIARVAASRASFSLALSPRAAPASFDLEGDGKILVRARVSNPRPPRYSSWLTLIVDTGATKSVLFRDALRDHVAGARAWASLTGLTAPTLFGAAAARIVRIPSIELETAGSSPVSGIKTAARRRTARVVIGGMDAVVIESDLEDMLSRAVGRRVDGLLGYSFLKNFRIAIDFPRRILWLDPLPAGWDGRTYEYSHIGLQVERRDEAITVVGIAENSPAAAAGIRKGDQVASVDGKPSSRFDVAGVSRYLEGRPGTVVEIVVRRGGKERYYRLKRRRLL